MIITNFINKIKKYHCSIAQFKEINPRYHMLQKVAACYEYMLHKYEYFVKSLCESLVLAKPNKTRRLS